MDDIIDSLGDNTIFSTSDENSGCWRAEIAEEGRNRTVFSSPHGLFRSTTILFGLKRAPGTFQRLMEVSLTKLNRQFALEYLEHVLMFSLPLGKHIQRVRQIMML